jgi:outer membrane receptor for ferrienterochelin and colicins
MRARAALAAALLAVTVGAAHASRLTAQSAPVTLAGAVAGRGDEAPVLGAVVLLLPSGVRTRTDEHGLFRVAARTGDTLLVRALGFRESRLVLGADALRQLPLTIRLDPLATVLPTFLTTMGQRVIRASESPRSVVVVTKKELDAVAAVSVNQLLRQLPGLQELPAPPSKTSISIRGFDDARVLVLVDGEPVAGALMESRDIGRLSSVGTERIEVTKGPSSVEFGSDALGGVINIVRAAPSPSLTADWLARRGGLGRMEASGGVSNTAGRLGYRLNGGWRQSDRVTGYNAAGSTFNRLYDLRTDWRYDLGRKWTARLDVQGSQERQRFPVDADFNGFIDNRGAQGFAEVQGPALGGLLRARAFQQRFWYQYRQSRELLPIRGSADSLEQQERQGRYLLAYTRVLGAHAIDVGAQRSNRTLIAPQKIDGDSIQDAVTEVFARDSWTIGGALLTLGARHTASSLWGSSTNPSLGVAYQATPAVRLRSNVARGFRAPGFKEIRFSFFNPAAGYNLVGNPELQPETSVSYSAGATWAPNSLVSLDVEAYRNDVHDLIEWRFLGFNAAGFQDYANVNVARARTQGAEFNARATLGGTEFSLGYDHLWARDLSRNLPLSRRASHTARFRASHTFGVLRGLETDLSTRYTSSAPLVGIPSGGPVTGPLSTAPGIIGRQGALLSIDGQLRLVLTPTTELSGGVNNLLNQRPALWTPAFDRQFFVGLQVRWNAVH